MSHVEGLSQITSNLNKAMGREIAKMNARLNLAGDVLHAAVQHQASLTDHTLLDLAKTKPPHPYSTKYDDNTGPHKDDTLVHIQTGRLYRNIKKVSDMGGVKSSVAVGVRQDDVPYIDELMYGSPQVRPRRFIQRAFTEMKPLVADIIGGGTK
jgi:hypothetical protein